MNVIYEPRGRALEYSPLACNLYMGCTHGCKYCYAPACMHKRPEAWHDHAECRANIKVAFEKDLRKLSVSHDTRRVLFCFLSDPYQPLERTERLTRWGIQTAQSFGIKVDILSKGEASLIEEDLPLMKAADTHLGITLSFINDSSRQEWEPYASTVKERLAILKKAHDMGVYTWVSMEPVIIPSEALEVIKAAHPYVDFWKVGKLNHNRVVESTVDWVRFREDVTTLLEQYGCRYYIKEDLRNVS